MADAQYGENRSFNLHSSGTDMVEGSALAVKSSSGALAIDGITVGSVNALRIAIMDGSGNQITSFGGGTQYAVDAALGATPTGTLALAQRDDSLSALTPVDGDAVSLRTDAVGALWVNIYSQNQALDVSGSSVEAVVGGDVAHDAADGGAPIKVGGHAYTGTPTAVANNDRTDAWFGSRGQLATMLVDGSGNAVAVGGGTQYAEDAALGAVGSATGTLSVGRASAAAPTSVSADADAVGLWASRFGALNVILRDTSGAAVATGTQYVEDVALGAVGSATGTLIVGRASAASTPPTAVSADADAVGAWFDSNGAQMVGIGPGFDRQSSTQLFNAAAQTLAISTVGASAVVAVITAVSSPSLTLTFEYTVDGSTWSTIGASAYYGPTAAIAPYTTVIGTGNTAGQRWVANALGARQWRLRCTSYTSGSMTVQMYTRNGPGNVPSLSVGDLRHADNENSLSYPIKIGGHASTAALAGGANDTRVDAWFTLGGAQYVSLATSSGAIVGGDANGVYAQGNLANDAVDAGNPLKVGGKARNTLGGAVASGDRVDLQLSRLGYVLTSHGAGRTLGDAASNIGWDYEDWDGGTVHGAQQFGYLFNTSTWDRARTVAAGDGAASTGIAAAGTYGYNGTTYDRLRTVGAGDAIAATGILGAGGYAYNSSTYDRLRNFNAYTTAAATPEIGILAAGQPDKRYTSVSLGTAVNSTQSWDTMGVDSLIVHVGTSTTGTFIFEVTADGSNWSSAETRDTALDAWVSGTNLTPTANKVYRIITNGWRSIRARTVTALGATVALTATTAARSTVLNAIDSGPAPHNFGYTAVNYTATYTSAQTSIAIESNAVSSTQRLVITSIQIQSYGTTAGTCVVYFGTGAYSRGTNATVFDGEFAPSSTSKPGFAQTWAVNAPIGALDEEIRITTTNAQSVTVNVWGYLIG